MAFCSKMNNSVKFVFIEQLSGALLVHNVCFFKNIVWCRLHVTKIFKISGISERINIHHPVFRIFLYKKTYNMRTNESGAAGDHDIFFKVSHYKLQYFLLTILFLKTPFKYSIN